MTAQASAPSGGILKLVQLPIQVVLLVIAAPDSTLPCQQTLQLPPAPAQGMGVLLCCSLCSLPARSL